MATHEIDTGAPRQPSREEIPAEGQQPDPKKLFYNSTTVSLSSHRLMMARAVMRHVLTSSGEASESSSMHQSNQEEDRVTCDSGVALLPLDQELCPFNDSLLVSFEPLNLREFINSKHDALGWEERVCAMGEQEDGNSSEDTEGSIVVRWCR